MADIFDLQECLLPFDLDSMVDDSLTNTCTLFDDNNSLSSIVQVQKTRSQDTSPFHESDSGVSEVSDFCDGGSPVGEPVTMLDEMLDNMTPIPFLVESDMDSADLDNDLVNYLENRSDPRSRNGPTTVGLIEHDSELCSQSGRLTRSKSAALSKPGKLLNRAEDGLVGDILIKRGTPQRVALRSHQSHNTGIGHTKAAKRTYVQSSSGDDDDSEIEITDCESAYDSAKNKPKGSVTVKQPGSALPSSSTNSNCNVTSVKVLRIVNSGNNSNTEDDVVKALEERNRKNAEMARANRMKKKAYVGNLEKEVEDGRKRIDELEALLNNVEEERDSWKREAQYLKSVLANQSALAGLLKNIPNVSGVTLSSSVSRKRVAELDHDYTPGTPAKQVCSQPQSSTAGVCLHVDSDSVSLEFCHHCADMAHGSLR